MRRTLRIIAGPFSGRIRVVGDDVAERAVREGFGKILTPGATLGPRRPPSEPHPAGEAFAEEIRALDADRDPDAPAGRGYAHRELRADPASAPQARRGGRKVAEIVK